ncbi:hypothetical protein CFC21_096606 [Triticum aestivum]|uniref:C2H2-type domain-containing protein n=4 Tax=Triticum TaxID=4564 RepID=A0A9R0Z7G0_TRITD|nr:Zinc finger protein 1 [Triticum urartu]KAF7094285.1 hypothetical protein CFC21_096606 [Triticum aestivum]VAI71694.1 unnamed protein product [Triticum turgidum subsp. durum]
MVAAAMQALFDQTDLSLSLSLVPAAAPALNKDDYLAICLAALAKSGQQVQGMEGQARVWRPAPAPAQELRFSCAVCGKAFASYQALGGHKRCHYWDGTSVSMSVSVSVSASSSVLRNFDLNLLPMPENVNAGLKRWAEEEEVQSPLPAKKLRLLL